MINDVRKKKLKLRPITYLSGSQGSETDIPHGYIWSPHLVPKPKGPKIDVVGFCFLDLSSNYKPPEELVHWLEAGPKPIYIGFGSLPIQEPEKMTQTIVKALEMTGQRGIINKGWGGLGILTEPKDFVYSLDNIPHDWLFLQCAYVVHHGGAGTTTAGLKVVLSYQIVDSLIWLGIRDMINDVRKKKLKLRPITYLSGSQGSETDIPHGYIWSPHLVPKPKGPKIDVVGFCFLDLSSNYKPPEELVHWLEAGPKPIYIGFGSLPVQEPEKMTQTIVKALEMTGQRGIINKGWGGLGILTEPKDFVYSLDNIPHDWLFLQCAYVVHHGGAGTTTAGLKVVCPTTIVPFFGDQPFWGERVHSRGIGPPPIPVDQFNLTKLVDAIKFMLDPKVKERAVELAKAMENKDGVEGAVKAFLKHLPQQIPPDCKPSSTKPRTKTKPSKSKVTPPKVFTCCKT
ncbi:hypothetical protein Lser_V15G24737 [Lactuca serriola]